MFVKDVMTKQVITIKKDAPIMEAARLLYTHNFTGMPVTEGETVIGVVTESDFILKHINVHLPSLLMFFQQLPFRGKAKKKNIIPEYTALMKTTVGDIMTTPPVTISEDADIALAAKIFTTQRVNPLPVVDKQKHLIGIISKADLLKIAVGQKF